MKFVMSPLLALCLVSCASDPKTETVPADTVAAPTTSDKIASIQDRLRSEDAGQAVLDEPVYHIDQPRFAPFRLSDGRLEFRGRTLRDVEQALGKAFDSKQSGDRAVVLYRIHPDDSTTLYLFAENGTIERFRLDEFNGWDGSSALSWFTL